MEKSFRMLFGVTTIVLGLYLTIVLWNSVWTLIKGFIGPTILLIGVLILLFSANQVE